MTLREAVTSISPKYRWFHNCAGYYVESAVCPLLRGFGHTRDEAADIVWNLGNRFAETDATEWGFQQPIKAVLQPPQQEVG